MKLFICILAFVASAMAEQTNADLLKSSNEVFTAKMFQEVVKSNPGQNVVLSAFSVLSPLAQLSLASEGATHDEILTAIGMPNDNVTKEVFTDVTRQLRAVKGVELSLVNKVYIRNNALVNDEFAALSRDVFNSDVQNIDFTQNVEAAKEINTWVEENTNHKIKDLVSSGSLGEQTAAVLVNAIYFKGSWKRPFPKHNTEDKDFYVSKEVKVKKPTMRITSTYKYGESQELNAKLLEIPYEGDVSSLLIVLPNEIDGIGSVVEKLNDPSVLSKAVDGMSYNEVSIDLPRFKIETTTDLKAILKQLDIKTVFIDNLAKISKLVKTESDLFVSEALQKAFIDVNEEGTEAAAANEMQMAPARSLFRKVVPPKLFTVDRPFYFYLIINKRITFNGILYK